MSVGFIHRRGTGEGGIVNDNTIIETFILDSDDITNKQIVLANNVINNNLLTLQIKGAPGQFLGDDFIVLDNVVSWSSLGLDGILEIDNKVTVIYQKEV